MNTPTAVDPPPDSRIARQLQGANFHDAWAIDAADPSLSALGQFLKSARATPRWVDACMRLVKPMHRLIAPSVLRTIGLRSQVNA